MKIADGVSGPTFNSVDILSGTVFAANNSGSFPGSYVFSRTAYQGVVTVDGTVSANGKLATMSLNGAGVAIGAYAFSLINTPEGRTNFAGVFTNINEGHFRVTYCGDINGDFKVDVVDLGLLATYWKRNIVDPPIGDLPVPSPDPWENGDFNYDGEINVVDLGLMATNWKRGVSDAPVPEPASLSLLVLGTLAVLKRRGA